MEEDFNPQTDYTKTGEYYEKKNYKAYLANLHQDILTRLLSDKIVGSKLELSRWQKQEIAESLAEIKFGKEED